MVPSRSQRRSQSVNTLNSPARRTSSSTSPSSPTPTNPVFPAATHRAPSTFSQNIAQDGFGRPAAHIQDNNISYPHLRQDTINPPPIVFYNRVAFPIMVAHDLAKLGLVELQRQNVSIPSSVLPILDIIWWALAVVMVIANATRGADFYSKYILSVLAIAGANAFRENGFHIDNLSFIFDIGVALGTATIPILSTTSHIPQPPLLPPPVQAPGAAYSPAPSRRRIRASGRRRASQESDTTGDGFALTNFMDSAQ
ncbi:hypothetical protein NA57DRAFT_60757 [Rhizodiscina lignyota]|uniref:Uncharacterized protein n=1 Tax=Rhizodiscina lignyota TaxID=1504668 RepID=A0A9P4I605_9PEZI|nr:hypothetical protein NA57DRAFT_60757 [Rhizodiscina lignyota]